MAERVDVAEQALLKLLQTVYKQKADNRASYKKLAELLLAD
jgi:hypothetical protein